VCGYRECTIAACCCQNSSCHGHRNWWTAEVERVYSLQFVMRSAGNFWIYKFFVSDNSNLQEDSKGSAIK